MTDDEAVGPSGGERGENRPRPGPSADGESRLVGRTPRGHSLTPATPRDEGADAQPEADASPAEASSGSAEPAELSQTVLRPITAPHSPKPEPEQHAEQIQPVGGPNGEPSQRPGAATPLQRFRQQTRRIPRWAKLTTAAATLAAVAATIIALILASPPPVEPPHTSDSVEIRAVNSTGQSQPLVLNGTPQGQPSAPRTGSVETGDGRSEGTFTSVSAGGRHTCGIKADSTLACWGYSEDGRSDPPEGTFTSVSAGGRHTCGIKADSTLACWGDNFSGQSDPPEGTFTSVSAGYWHTCGIKADSTLACWGFNGFGESDPPEGIFTSVSAGGWHACGIKADSTLACWGSDGWYGLL